MSKRILLAGLFHETHTFLDEITRADAVRVRRGEELLARRGDADIDETLIAFDAALADISR